MSKKNEEDKQDLGYGGLRAPSRPQPAISPGVEFTDSKVDYSSIRTDGAGLPLVPKEQAQYMPARGAFDTNYLLVDGEQIERPQAEQLLQQWFALEVEHRGNHPVPAVALLIKTYTQVNDQAFPDWAVDFLQALQDRTS